MNAFVYRAPRTVDEVLTLLAEHGDDARVIAGGTALVTMMKQRLVRPEVLVSLRDVEGLSGIQAAKGEIRLGALTTHREAEVSPLVNEHSPVLADTFRRVATVRIRHMATVGGSLAHADPNQDPPVTLMALDAKVEVRHARGRREVPIGAFFRDYYETALEPGELITAVTVPPLPRSSGGAYVKFLPRSADDYATVAVAAMVTLEADGERLREGRIALGSAAPTAVRARAAETLLAGSRLDERLLAAVGEAVQREVDPLTDHRGSAGYKREMAAVIVGRALTQACDAARRAPR